MTITLYDMQDSPYARKVRLLAAERANVSAIKKAEAKKGC